MGNIIKQLVGLTDEFLSGGHSEQRNAILPVLEQYEIAVRAGYTPALLSPADLAALLAGLRLLLDTPILPLPVDQILRDAGCKVDRAGVEALRERLNGGEG